jgi:hypothetical protein
VDGHVATADCSVVTAWNPETLALQELFRKGVKYRPGAGPGVVSPATIEDMVQAVDNILPHWIRVLEETLQTLGGPPHIWTPYRDALKQEVRNMLHTIPSGTPLYNPHTLALEDEHITWLHKFHRYIMVTFVDKLSLNYAFICLKRAAQLLIEDFNNSINTRIMDTTELALIDRLHDQIRPHGLTITNHNSVLPPYILSYKAHGDKYRMIVAANKAPMNSAVTVVTWLVKSMTPHLKLVWKTLI